MLFKKSLFIYKYFPCFEENIPFGELLNEIFFNPQNDKDDYPIHGPNVIRFIPTLLDGNFSTSPGLLPEDGGGCMRTYQSSYQDILRALDIEPGDTESIVKITELLKVGALYHDIGKFIKRANHPQIGRNIIRNYNEADSELLVNRLVYEGENDDTLSKYNRFTLISSIIEHHDKFGVVSTGEGALPIFSDILYFTSNKDTLNGIKKNVTSVMLINLADIAAVNTSKKEVDSVRIVREIMKLIQERNTSSGSNVGLIEESMKELEQIYGDKKSCLGLSTSKVTTILQDWEILIRSIVAVDGDRTQLKTRLLEIEQNPSRTIHRILRLLNESAITGNANSLIKFLTPNNSRIRISVNFRSVSFPIVLRGISNNR